MYGQPPKAPGHKGGTVYVSTMRRLTVGAGLAVTLGILGVNTSSASAAEISSTATVSTNRCIMMSTL
jgi:hypothetical protein